MRKTTLILFLIFLQLLAYANNSGTCGENLTWIFDETSGTLSITGTGKMEGYSQNLIPWYEFHERIKAIDIGDGVTSIGTNAFAKCSNLVSVIIPDGVTTIDNSAFVFCESLSSVTIGAGVTSIGNNAFSSCNSLASIVIPDGVVSIGHNVFSNCKNLTTVTIGDGLTSISKNTFRSCENLKEVSIGNNVSIISEGAFYECGNLLSVTIPSSVTHIYKQAFYGCNSITKLKLGEHIDYIGDYAFANCNSLASVILPPSVTSIGWYAFSGCHSLTSIVIPNSVTYIAEGAFSNCSGLTAISIEEGNSKYDSRDNCNAIIETLSNRIIVGCQTTKIPNSVITIGRYSFCGSKLTSLDIPNNITSIEGEAFNGCTMLSSIIIPNNVTSLGGGAFYGCSNLSSISIPDNIQTIEGNTFDQCSSLKIIELGSGITKIKSNAFKDCNSLAIFTCKAETPPEAYYDYNLSNSFRNVSLSQINLFVPASSKELYKTSFPWMYFGKIRSIGKYYKATLTSKGNGQINYGSNVIRNTTESYELESKEGLKLTFIPDEGHSLESVFVNGLEIENELSFSLDSLEENIDITASFVVNSYKLTYMVDGETYKTSSVPFGSKITPEVDPSKEGYTFSGWSETPETMPANDVIIKGYFTINSYTVTYVLDGEVYTTETSEYGAKIVPPVIPGLEDYSIWEDVPETMPAKDITIYGKAKEIIDSIGSIHNSQFIIHNEEVYDLSGRKIDFSFKKKDINIIRMKDGTVRKIFIK